MSVYVDNFQAKYGRMIMSHMMADSLGELHDMADKIGIRRKWFQNNKRFPHYDICQSKKNSAIKFGAKEITAIELVKKFRNNPSK